MSKSTHTLWKLLLLATPLVQPVWAQTPEDRCANLKTEVSIANTTILESTRVTPGLVSTPSGCKGSNATVSSGLCRVVMNITTSTSSSLQAEAWLPDVWYGRFLTTGNGGLNGCIDYPALDYGSSMHFATIGSDNGHAADVGDHFLNQPEVIVDYSYRAIHTITLVGKSLVSEYYSRSHDKSYYIGCSTGGRQGVKSILNYPTDFDGVVGGSPAVDFNRLIGWMGILGRDIGAPNGTSKPEFISPALWPVVSAEIMKQCDELDGVKDNIITEPDECSFHPETLLCGTNGQTTNCLSEAQVTALKNVYSPLYGNGGEFVYPRYDPGAEGSDGWKAMFSGNIHPYTSGWMNNAVYNTTQHDYSNFNATDIALADSINAGGVATFDGHMDEFRERGGKFITYHGRSDPIIASGISKRLYNLTSTTVGQSNMDSFYKLFLIPGMTHCFGGSGAWKFGQSNQGFVPSKNDSSHNALLAVVDWVENGNGPQTLVGTSAEGKERVHCGYPAKSVWDGENFSCVN